MTKMLASVNSVEEALLVLNAGIDIIDLKQPSEGALGALPLETVSEIVQIIAKRCPISATVGDLVMQPDLVFNAVQAMANTGVDYIKIGFFPNGDALATIEKLAELTARHALIAVLFADTQPDFSMIHTLQQAGFVGVMLDTMDKQRGSLVQILNHTELSQFVRMAKATRLLCGLAGSLRITDIPVLLSHSVDYLGFRGALCVQQQRTASLDSEAVKQIKYQLLRK